MVYFVAKVVPFVAKGGPVLMAKGGILPVAEIGILYLTIYTPFVAHILTPNRGIIHLYLRHISTKDWVVFIVQYCLNCCVVLIAYYSVTKETIEWM